MSGRLEIIAPDRDKHREGMADLIAKAFPSPSYYETYDTWREWFTTETFYDWSASRIGLMDGVIVTHWGVWDYLMRIGSGRVRVGGVTGVTTHGDYRNRGLMIATGEASLIAMREAGYDMSILFGIRNFYHRFGYVRSWNETAWIVKVAELPSEPPDPPIRKFASGRYRSDVGEIYNRQNATATGTAVRPTYRRRMTDVQGYLWTGRGGRTEGYVIFRRKDNQIVCTECGGRPEQILRVLHRLGRRLGCKEVRFNFIPYDHPVVLRLRRGNCRAETTYIRKGLAMARTVNLRSTLKKMTGELSRRIGNSGLTDWRGELLIADPRDEVGLAVESSKVRVIPPTGRSRKTKHVIRGGEEIAQLLIGTQPPNETVKSAGIKLIGDAKVLIGILFPDRHPVLGWRDRF